MMQEAIERLRKELKEAKGLGRCAQVMAKPVADKLCDFCEQDEEFAQAVVQGGNFSDCMKAVENGVGGAISDIEAYTKAVRFYFPGAKIDVTMTVDLVGDAAEPAAPKRGVVLDLMDFM